MKKRIIKNQMTGVRLWSNIVIDNPMARLPITNGQMECKQHLWTKLTRNSQKLKKIQAEDLLELDPVHVCVRQDTIFVF